jgi:hypothetical protein
MKKISSSVPGKSTILQVAVKILVRKKRAMSPREISDEALKRGLLTLPRFRTRSYLTQLVQSTLHRDVEYSSSPILYRPVKGKYDVIPYSC